MFDRNRVRTIGEVVFVATARRYDIPEDTIESALETRHKDPEPSGTPLPTTDVKVPLSEKAQAIFDKLIGNA